MYVVPLQLSFYLIFAGPAYEPRTVTGLHVTDQQPTTGAPPLGVPSKSRVAGLHDPHWKGLARCVEEESASRDLASHTPCSAVSHAAQSPMRRGIPSLHPAKPRLCSHFEPHGPSIHASLACQQLGCIPPPFSPAKKADHQAPGGRVLAQRKQRREPSPGADVAGVSPVPAQMWPG